MAKDHTKKELWEKLAAASHNMAAFYRQDFINYRGRTADTGELYTEVIAAWCLQNWQLFENIPRICRQTSYCTAAHTGAPANPESGREEEHIAVALYRQKVLPPVGRILDYQTPLKNRGDDRAGKIDLLAWDGQTVRILELKRPGSRQTMLRCALEGYTYLRTVDGQKLLADFCLPADAPLTACPLVFYKGAQWHEMQAGRPYLQQLMTKMNSIPYYLKEENGSYTAEV